MAGNPTPETDKAPTRSRLRRSNRSQMLLFAGLTFVLTVATVWGVRIWLQNSETLTFAVGEANGLDARFADKLATVLKNTNSRLRVKIVGNADRTKALAQFDRRQADLAVLRTDEKIPPRARALAILEDDVLLLISPGKNKIKSLADLKKKKIIVLGEGAGTLDFVRKLLQITDGSEPASHVEMAPPDTTLEKLFAGGGYGAAIAIAHSSLIEKDNWYERHVKRGAFTLNAITDSKALARRHPGTSEETLAKGILSSTPAIPDDDLDTIKLQWLLVAQSRMSSSTAGELARTIYENKAELALADGFASRIEPADTDKDAFVVAHQGASEYINDNTKSFMERYSDTLYFGAATLSIIGSIFAGLYAKVTRVAPEKASELATVILDIGERIEHAGSLTTLERLQVELESVLRGVVIGLRDGTISSDGLEAFKLGYELVRDEIGMRRDSLKRHAAQEPPPGHEDQPRHEDQPGHEDQPAREPRAGHEDNVVVVKTAHGA